MPTPSRSKPRMIREMETIQMPIGEISSRLSDLVGQASYFELLPFGDSVFVSDIHDIVIRTTRSGNVIDVSEPKCGQPNLEIALLRDNTQLREEIAMLWTQLENEKNFYQM